MPKGSKLIIFEEFQLVQDVATGEPATISQIFDADTVEVYYPNGQTHIYSDAQHELLTRSMALKLALKAKRRKS